MAGRFSNIEYARRYALVRQVLAEHDVAAVVIYGTRGLPGLVEYLTAFPPRQESYLVVPCEGEPTLFLQFYNHVPSAQRTSILADTRWGGADSVQTVSGHLRERGYQAARIAVAGPMPFQRYLGLQQELPQAHWIDLTGPLGRLRWVKSDEELEWMRRAANLTDKAVAALVDQVRPGMRDCDLPAVLQAAVASEGGQVDLAYLASTSMREPCICVPAQNLSTRAIQPGDVIIAEIGISVDGYAGQIQRPFAIKEPPTPEYRRLYDVALEAYHEVAASIRPGATDQDVLAAADLIDRAGFSVYDDLVHGFGGGYLPPVLRTRQTSHGSVPFTFEKNMCIVVQPNVISRDERMGVQLGQLHIVTDHGLESLQHYPTEFRVIG